MRKNYKVFAYVRKGLGILFGSILFGIGYSWFLIPYKIAPGGVGGISEIFYHIFKVNVGITMLAFNIPLWIIGIIFINRQFGAGTFIGFFSSSIMTELLSPDKLYKIGLMTNIIEKYNKINGVFKPVEQWAMTDNVFLASIAGSIFLGIGLGIIFKSGGSTGGTDIPAALLKKYFNISIGNSYIIIETFIILLIGIVFGDLNLVIWGYFTLFLSTRFNDFIIEGLPRVKAAMIIPSSMEKGERLKEHIYNNLGRGVTYLKGFGTYHRIEKDIIFVVFNLRQTVKLMNIVKEGDPNAFMVMYDVHDVMGYGFKSRTFSLDD